MRGTIVIGFSCGVACGTVVWIFAHPFAWWVPVAGGIAGAAYALTSPRRIAPLEDIVSASALAIPFWALVEVIAVPVLIGVFILVIVPPVAATCFLGLGLYFIEILRRKKALVRQKCLVDRAQLVDGK